VIIRDKVAGGVSILELYGQLTGEGNAAALRQAIREQIEKGHEKIVVNLRGLDAIDSGGLGELVACHWRLQRQGGSLYILTRDPGMIFEILMKVRLNQVFSILDDEGDIPELA